MRLPFLSRFGAGGTWARPEIKTNSKSRR